MLRKREMQRYVKGYLCGRNHTDVRMHCSSSCLKRLVYDHHYANGPYKEYLVVNIDDQYTNNRC